MIAVLTEARRASIGVFRMLAFREDWRSYFDISSEGVVRSFSGIILSMPAFAFTFLAIGYVTAETLPAGSEGGMSLAEAALTWGRYWLLFPFVAALTAMVAGLSDRFAGWLVVQNWSVFVMVHIQALLYALYVAGLADFAALAQMMALYIAARAMMFWRIAAATLEVPMGFALAMAGIPYLVDFGLRALTQQ